MPALDIILDGNNCWPDLFQKEFIHLANDAPPIGVAILDAGMTSGKPSVTIRIDLPDGKVVLAETSARLFCTAAKMFMAKYPDLFEGE